MRMSKGYKHNLLSDKRSNNEKQNSETKVLSSMTIDYFLRIAAIIEEKEASKAYSEELEVLVSNAYNEAKGGEHALCQDKTCAIALEKILKHSSPQQLCEFASAIMGNCRDLTVHYNGSRVMECLVSSISKYICQDDGNKELEDTLLAICEIIKEYFGVFLVDENGTHVVRRILYALSAEEAPPSPSGSGSRLQPLQLQLQAVPKKAAVQPQPACIKILAELVERAFQEDLPTIATHIHGGPTLQVMVFVTRNSAELNSNLACQIMRLDEKSNNAGVALLHDKTGSHMVQAILQHSTPELYTTLYQSFFRSHLEELALHPFANHVVQSLISFAPSAPHISMIAQELVPFLPTIMIQSHFKVVIRLVDACGKFKQYEKEVFKVIVKILLPEYPIGQKEIAKLLIELNTHGSSFGKFSENGAQLVMGMLNFTQQIVQPLIDSIFKLPIAYLVEMAKSKTACRVLEILLEGSMMLSSKQHFIEKFKGYFAELSSDKYGAFFVERMFASADIKRKEIIAGELVLEEEKVAYTVQGRVVLFRCNIKQYKAAHTKWLDAITTKETKKRLLKDVVSASPSQTTSHALSTKKAKIEVNKVEYLTSNPSPVARQTEIDDLFKGTAESQVHTAKNKQKLKKGKFVSKGKSDNKVLAVIMASSFSNNKKQKKTGKNFTFG